MLLLGTAINMRREEEGKGGKGRTKEGKREGRGRGRERGREREMGEGYIHWEKVFGDIHRWCGALEVKQRNDRRSGRSGWASGRGSGGGRGSGRSQRLFGGFICFCFLVIRFICLLFCVLCFIGDIICFCLLILWLFCLHFLVLSILFVFVETSLLAGFVGF